MFAPEATAARMARLPEWAKVPSPRFCTRCRWVTNGAMPIHCAPSPPIWHSPMTSPTCSSGMNATIAWQPIPPPTSVPGATLVEELCGQPEQKYGMRCASGSMTRSRGGRSRGWNPRGREVAGESVGDGVGVELAHGREQRGAVPRPLAVDGRGAGLPVQHGLHRVLEEGALVLDDDDLVEASGEPGDDARLKRVDHAELEQPDAVPFEVVLRQPERGEGLADVQVGLAGGHQADPGAARPRDDVQAAAADVLGGDGQPGELLAALQLGELRAEQAGPRLVTVGAQAAGQIG